MSNRKWYDNKLVVVLLLFTFFPVGLYGLWKNKAFTNKSKKILAVSALCIFIISAAINPYDDTAPTTTNNKSANNQNKIAINLETGSISQAKTKTTRSAPKTIKSQPEKKFSPADLLQHMKYFESILAEIEQRRRRLEDGYSYRNGAWLAAWNRETQNWTKQAESKIEEIRISRNVESACFNASLYTKLSLNRLAQLGIGYVFKDRRPEGVSTEQQLLREEYQTASKWVRKCKEKLSQKVATH